MSSEEESGRKVAAWLGTLLFVMSCCGVEGILAINADEWGDWIAPICLVIAGAILTRTAIGNLSE